MNLFGVGSPPFIVDKGAGYTGGDYSLTGRYQIHDVNTGLIWVPNLSRPYGTQVPAKAQITAGETARPLAFATLDEVNRQLTYCEFGQLQNSGTYSFWGRNPRFEMAQALDAYKQNADEFDYVDSLITARLTARSVTNAGAIYNFIASKVINQDSNQQYALGLSAASGGGQNTTYIANSISATQYQAFAESALKIASETPIVTPFESPLIAESHAQGVEAKNAGEIRDQQIRQAIASALGVNSGISQATQLGGGAAFTGLDGASILIGARGQQGAAMQT
jgi:hypothetical protein